MEMELRREREREREVKVGWHGMERRGSRAEVRGLRAGSGSDRVRAALRAARRGAALAGVNTEESKAGRVGW